MGICRNGGKINCNKKPKFLLSQKFVYNYIKKAHKQMEKAKDDLEDGKYIRAINHYKKSWKYTQKVIEWAEK